MPGGPSNKEQAMPENQTLAMNGLGETVRVKSRRSEVCVKA